MNYEFRKFNSDIAFDKVLLSEAIERDRKQNLQRRVNQERLDRIDASALAVNNLPWYDRAASSPATLTTATTASTWESTETHVRAAIDQAKKLIESMKNYEPSFVEIYTTGPALARFQDLTAEKPDIAPPDNHGKIPPVSIFGVPLFIEECTSAAELRAMFRASELRQNVMTITLDGDRLDAKVCVFLWMGG
jgi:hypothetical protein